MTTIAKKQLTCATCGKLHNRKKFCSNKCKDRFHNVHNPRGIFAFLKDTDHSSSSVLYADDDDLIDREGGGWDDHKDSI